MPAFVHGRSLVAVPGFGGVGREGVAGAGDATASAYQGELFFLPGCLLRILNVDLSGDTPVIGAEVRRP